MPELQFIGQGEFNTPPSCRRLSKQSNSNSIISPFEER